MNSTSRTPPRKMPKKLYDAFTLGGVIDVQEWYFNDAETGGAPRDYKKKDIDENILKATMRNTNYYGKTDFWLYQSLEKYPVKDKEVVVMGSRTPWYESICLSEGARCSVIEYNEITCNDSRITYYTTEQYEKYHLTKRFDCGLSISSFEHDGLGRYGDPINPDGDIEAMSKMKITLKPNSLLFLAVPIGADCVVWNAHRIYGRARFHRLIQGWNLLDSFGFEEGLFDIHYDKIPGFQPLFVLQNSLNVQ